MKKIFILMVVLGLIILGHGITVKAVETSLGATITSGTLSIGNSTATTANFVTKAVGTSEQTTTANIGDTNATNTVGIEVSDSRGTGVGWAATMTSTNLVAQGSVNLLSGSNNTVGFSGAYNGVNAIFTNYGTYTVEITTGGAVGVAIFSWTDPAGTTTADLITASTFSLSNGLSVTFGPATYVVGDKWSISVDALRYNYSTTKGLTVTPSALHVVSGSGTGVTPGGATLLTGSAATSNPITILTAAADAGMGDYFIDLGLSQTIHPNAFAGSYTAVATLTVS